MSKLYRLHGRAGSRIWKPLWCMRELGIVEQTEISDVPIKIGRTVEIFPGEDDKREYYVNNVNPNGRMPTCPRHAHLTNAPVVKNWLGWHRCGGVKVNSCNCALTRMIQSWDSFPRSVAMYIFRSCVLVNNCILRVIVTAA